MLKVSKIYIAVRSKDPVSLKHNTEKGEAVRVAHGGFGGFVGGVYA